MNIASELLKPNVTQTFSLLYFTSKNQNIYDVSKGLHTRINSGLSAGFRNFSVAIYLRARFCSREKFSPDSISDTRGRSSIEKQVRRQVGFYGNDKVWNEDRGLESNRELLEISLMFELQVVIFLAAVPIIKYKKLLGSIVREKRNSHIKIQLESLDTICFLAFDDDTSGRNICQGCQGCPRFILRNNRKRAKRIILFQRLECLSQIFTER